MIDGFDNAYLLASILAQAATFIVAYTVIKRRK
jgi:hypothetical protein